MFRDNHAISQRSKWRRLVFILAQHIYANQSTRQWIENNVDEVEVRDDCVAIVVTRMLSPDDVSVIVANVAFLDQLLWIILHCRHHGGHVEDGLHLLCTPKEDKLIDTMKKSTHSANHLITL